MRITRAEAKERNRRALLAAARRVVARDGHRARLDEVAAAAGLTTGAVYSLFGSKNGLLIALVTDSLGPHYEGLERAVGADLDLSGAVAAFARFYRRTCDDPGALGHLSFEVSLQDAALRDPDLRARLADSIGAHERRLAEVFTGRRHGAATVTERQARRLAVALRGLLAGLSQRVVLELADNVSERYFAETARALVTPEVLGPP